MIYQANAIMRKSPAVTPILEMRSAAFRVVLVCFAFLTLSTSAGAQGIPKSGSINFHTGWKHLADALNATDQHLLGRGNATGVTFNDKGSGPLHLGPANCFEAFFVVEGEGKTNGFCAFGDPDGDRLFTKFSGTFGSEGAIGTNKIIGGTGKYSGIEGAGPWKCKMSGSNGELRCAQKLDYRLP